MTTVAVLGAFGQMGEACLHDLCASPSVRRVLAADIHPERSRSILTRLPNRSKVKAVRLDLSSPSARRALQGSEVVANCAWYELNFKAMELALALKAHYVDLGGLYHMTLKQLTLDSAFRRIGRTAVLGCGSTPGITNMMAERLVRAFDRVESVGIYDASEDPNQREDSFLPPFSIRTMLDEYQLPAPYFDGGKLKMVPPFSQEEEVLFPAPYGRAKAGTVIHSELATLPKAYKPKGLKRLFFKIVYPEGLKRQISFLASSGLASKEPVVVKGARVVPLELLSALALKAAARLPAKPRDAEILRVEVRGTEAGLPWVRTLDCHIRPVRGLSAGALGVGFPASVAAQLLASGEGSVGADGPEAALPVEPFFRHLLERGAFKLKETVRTGLRGGAARPVPVGGAR